MKTTKTNTDTEKESKASPIQQTESVKKKKRKKKKKQTYKDILNNILKSKASSEEKDKQKILTATGAGHFQKVIKI